MLIGMSAIVAFISSVLQDEAIQLVLNWQPTDDGATQPSLLLVYLERFGIIITALILYIGVFLIVIGWRLREGSIRVAQWAKIALMWITIGLGAVIALTLFNVIRLSDLGRQTVTTDLLLAEFGLLVPSFIFMGIIWLWFSQSVERDFFDDDRLLARETRLAWNLLIPTLAIIVLVAVRPLEQTFVRSLTDKRFASATVPQFVGLDNYARLMGIRLDTVPCRIDDETGACSLRANGTIRWESIDRELLVEGYRTVWNIPILFSRGQSLAISGLDSDFIKSVSTTLIFAVVSVSGELAIGLFMAIVVNSKFRGRGVMRAVMLVPWAIPTVISARLWELMLKDTSAGIVNKVLMDVSLINAPQAWLSDPNLQLPAAIIVDVWKTAPFMALILLAGLQTIPKDLYESASVDGASPIRQFFSITLPLLRPAIAIALVFRTLDALRVFDLFNVLFGRQQLSMATYNYETLVNNQLDGYASAVSVVIFFFISIFAFLYVRMLNVETD